MRVHVTTPSRVFPFPPFHLSSPSRDKNRPDSFAPPSLSQKILLTSHLHTYIYTPTLIDPPPLKIPSPDTSARTAMSESHQQAIAEKLKAVNLAATKEDGVGAPG